MMEKKRAGCGKALVFASVLLAPGSPSGASAMQSKLPPMAPKPVLVSMWKSSGTITRSAMDKINTLIEGITAESQPKAKVLEPQYPKSVGKTK